MNKIKSIASLPQETQEDIEKLATELGFTDEEDLLQKKNNPALRKKILIRTRAKFMGLCYALGDGQYQAATPRHVNENDFFAHEKRMRHLSGMIAIVKQVLLILEDKEFLRAQQSVKSRK